MKPTEIRAKTLTDFPDLYSISYGNKKAVSSQKKKDFFKKKHEKPTPEQDDKPLFT